MAPSSAEPLPSSHDVPTLTAEEILPAAAEASARRLRQLVREGDARAASEQQAVPRSLAELLGEPLAGRFTARLEAPQSPELQQELAALLALLPEVLEHLGSADLELLRTAVWALVAEEPQLEYSRGLRTSLRTAVNRKTRLLGIPNLTSRSPSALVVLGLGFFAYFVIPLSVSGLAMWMNRSQDIQGLKVLSFPALDGLLVCVAGAMGSVTSIMIRLREFETRKGAGPVDLMLFGFFKPFIGMFFGLFCYAIFQSGLLPTMVLPEGKENFFHFAVAFIAGFSERFARDIALRSEPGLPPGPTRGRG